MNKYKFLDKRDSAKANSPKPSGVSFNDNRPESLQMRNLQRQINSSTVVQKQAELQNGVNGVLQCYTKELVNITEKEGSKEYVAYKYAFVSEDADSEAIILEKNNKLLWVHEGKYPEPMYQFIQIKEFPLRYKNKRYISYKAKNHEGVCGSWNDCGLYAAVLAENDSSNFKKGTRHFAPKREIGNRVLFDCENERNSRYKKSSVPDPKIGEAYSFFMNNGLIPKLNVNHHIASVVFKTPTDCVTSEFNAAFAGIKEPYFEMYKGSKAKQGMTFDQKVISQIGKFIWPWKIRTPILTSIKEYYKQKDNEGNIVNRLDENNIPDKLEFEIFSRNDRGKYSVGIYDINNKGWLGAGKNVDFRNGSRKITIDYIEKIQNVVETRDNLLIYIWKKGFEYKYMGRLDVADMISNDSEVKMLHLENRKSSFFGCVGDIMSFRVKCKGIKNQNLNVTNPLNATNANLLPVIK
ncbi:MAG: hypothetical protein N4A72_15230 [Bacteroidales bacterium]|jgi:hypothetical protein|nr:hypothetical protein [Bacteroidales bacterium]